MRPFSPPVVAVLLALGLTACDENPPRFEQAEPDEALSGGSATVIKSDQNAFSMPSANLSPMRRLDFSVGNSFFRNPWVIAPASTTARDGLGPLINTNGCQNCHIKDGRGHPAQAERGNAVSMLVRLSIPAGEEIGSVTADGAYDTRKCHDAIAARGAHAVIPPRKNAKPWKTVTAGAIARNEVSRCPLI